MNLVNVIPLNTYPFHLKGKTMSHSGHLQLLQVTLGGHTVFLVDEKLNRVMRRKHWFFLYFKKNSALCSFTTTKELHHDIKNIRSLYWIT